MKCSMCKKSFDVSDVTKIHEYAYNEHDRLVVVSTDRFVCPDCRAERFELFDFEGDRLIQARFDMEFSTRFDAALESLRNTVKRKAL